MTRVNENVVAALKAAVSEKNQPKEIAQRLVAWLDALATGNVAITDDNEAAKRISDLIDLVRIPTEELDLIELDAETDL